ncbi:MAG: polyprenyl synthetase family protein, partial [Pseudomonadota bacterium]
MQIETYLKMTQDRVNTALLEKLPVLNSEPKKLHEAMHYAVLNGGKRLRSALIYAIGEALAADNKVLDDCAVAIELMHSFSLVHDDLPALDNDDLRRGKPACHIQFDQATAILAGDALLTLTFEVLANINFDTIKQNNILTMIKTLSRLVGSRGMAGGEALDVDLDEDAVNLESFLSIYRLKTSCLICASILLSAMAANCEDSIMLANLEKFGLYLGLAFQIHDDIIGIESSELVLGKPKDSDKKTIKPTYALIAGLDKAKQQRDSYLSAAHQYYENTGLTKTLIFVISRS